VVLGAMIATPLAIIGATMQLALHAVAKITLFFGAGAIQVAHDRKSIPELDGLGPGDAMDIRRLHRRLLSASSGCRCSAACGPSGTCSWPVCEAEQLILVPAHC
jgi:formate hydrogenlyase subunit 3/multisubunit Na+/H+ antiporter MnhD subunit